MNTKSTDEEVIVVDDFIKPINPGQTFNIYKDDHLTQIQHKGTCVDVVDHFDKGKDPVDFHIVHRIGPDGSIKMDY